VYLQYASHRLGDASAGISESSHLFGVPIGRKYIQRLAVLRAVNKFSELFEFQSLRVHPLKGNRSGQYALTLTGNYRLIIEKISEDKVLIVDVEDYHGN
jgi:plasmid maintenance system killer protein